MHTLMKDPTIELEADRPGALAKVFDTIAKARINIERLRGGRRHSARADG